MEQQYRAQLFIKYLIERQLVEIERSWASGGRDS